MNKALKWILSIYIILSAVLMLCQILYYIIVFVFNYNIFAKLYERNPDWGKTFFNWYETVIYDNYRNGVLVLIVCIILILRKRMKKLAIFGAVVSILMYVALFMFSPNY